jgi:glyoxylase I family protein
MTRADYEAELLGLETELLQSDVRRDGSAIERLLARDFVEFGASGRVYSRDAIAAALSSETPERRTLSDFAVRWLGDDVALVTYVSTRPGQRSLRSSIWRRLDGAWRMVFHQGTPSG